MVVVSLEPTRRFMERSGIATSTRRVARELWPDGLPTDRPLEDLVRELYRRENAAAAQPSGSQDMIGIIYPGVSRLDYDAAYEGGVYPSRIESTHDPDTISWLEKVIHVLPVAPRPTGYDPLGQRDLSPEWVRRLGQCGLDCWHAIVARDIHGLGAAMTESVTCWQAILPDSFTHPSLTTDWLALLDHYQSRYPGATVSASGGGYLYVVSEEVVPGTFRIRTRRRKEGEA